MKTLYVDMDNVIVDFKTGIEKISENEKVKYEGRYDEVPRIFSLMDPMEGAIEAFNKLSSKYDTYILSTSPWNNPSASCPFAIVHPMVPFFLLSRMLSNFIQSPLDSATIFVNCFFWLSGKDQFTVFHDHHTITHLFEII